MIGTSSHPERLRDGAATGRSVSPGCGEITIGTQQILGSPEPGRSLPCFVISPRLEQRAEQVNLRALAWLRDWRLPGLAVGYARAYSLDRPPGSGTGLRRLVVMPMRSGLFRTRRADRRPSAADVRASHCNRGASYRQAQQIAADELAHSQAPVIHPASLESHAGSHRLAAGAAHHQVTVPGGRGQPRLPFMCCNRARTRRTGPLPSSGHPWPGQGQSVGRGQAPAGLPQTSSRHHPPDQPGMTMHPLGTSARGGFTRTSVPYMTYTQLLA